METTKVSIKRVVCEGLSTAAKGVCALFVVVGGVIVGAVIGSVAGGMFAFNHVAPLVPGNLRNIGCLRSIKFQIGVSDEEDEEESGDDSGADSEEDCETDTDVVSEEAESERRAPDAPIKGSRDSTEAQDASTENENVRYRTRQTRARTELFYA